MAWRRRPGGAPERLGESFPRGGERAPGLLDEMLALATAPWHRGKRAVFTRALQSGNLVVAEGMARELGQITLAEATELLALIAKREPARLERVGVLWLERFIQEQVPTLREVTLAVAAISALPDGRRDEALRLLRAFAGSF